MREQDEIAQNYREKMDDGKYKRKQVFEGGKIEGSNVTYKDLLNTNFDDVKKLRKDKSSKFDRLNELKNRERQL